MNKSLRIYLLALIALVVVVFLIDSSRVKPLDWYPSYGLNEKKPMDLYILNKEIDSLLNTTVIRYNKTPYEYLEKKDKNSSKTYLAINNYLEFDLESWDELLNHVQAGSTLWVSATNFPVYITDTLGTETDYKYIPTHVASILNKDTLRLSLTNARWKEQSYDLSPIIGQYPFSNIDTATTTVLGFSTYADSVKHINYIRIAYGKGAIFLHNQASVFTNYSLMQKNAMTQYAARALSYIPHNQPVVWFVKQQTEADDNATPLSVLFRYPSLRAVWLIFIYGIILFLLFQAKRRQRVIPIIKPLQNTTVEFTQTIGNLYYQEGEVSNIVQKKIVFFLDKVRTKYHLDTQRLDEAFIRKLHVKANKDIDLVTKIVNFIRWFNEKGNASEHDLIRLNNLLDDFWKKNSPKS